MHLIHGIVVEHSQQHVILEGGEGRGWERERRRMGEEEEEEEEEGKEEEEKGERLVGVLWVQLQIKSTLYMLIVQEGEYNVQTAHTCISCTCILYS